ncbi:MULTISPECIES: hypothetical protein [Fusobacterium]|uniref:hypothetical protein n=1 Tax=Fusobacterium TaxID=848 RepID=UPI001F3B0E1E|nr:MULTISPECIES: hypothetical protein [Fusobacterium]MCF2612903.1 hypothetical protein [Fusobacterium perfoetens]MDY2981049.1 hypothetical protein [Fusobacterium sp.]
MKKLALLLAALSVASVSYAKEVMPEAAPVVEEAPVVEQEVVEVKAAPVLRVTSVGQTLKVVDTSSQGTKNDANIGEAVHLENRVGLALGDNWTFNLMARKTWEASTDDAHTGKEVWDGMRSAGHRIDLQATRNFENFSLGLRWRGEKNQDAIFLPVSYKFGMVSGWFDPAYYFVNGDNANAEDYFYLEAEPVQLSYGPVTLAYYFEGFKYAGDGCVVEDKKSDYAHQARLRGTLFQNDDFKVGAEYRYQFAQDVEMLNGKDGLENNKHTAILSLAYNVTENLVVDTYYQYNFNKYEANDASAKDDDYKGEFGLGWTYNF